ncbi:MAG: N-acetyl-gamma-glutamyl-phosphate reductase [Candidatus Methylomirabilota bacterium]|nr:N-acetyl-gamma-glutamyl-phosphate reductase [Candidatus Methylomirabilis sp.]PWB48827.1 MAG: N-acetyl-gamma-glutamyl-phosphate reductase [candidate division NC10 bacterium]
MNKKMNDTGHKIRVAVVGASGYTGVELLRLLINHPAVEITALTSESYADTPIDTIFPSLYGMVTLTCNKLDAREVARHTDLIFLAVPHKTAMAAAVELRPFGKKIVDLSADFRLRDAALYRQWYGTEHVAPELLKEAVYALPELYRQQLATTRLAAAPGCYPTAVLLGLLPLVTREIIDPDSLVIDAISGASGAGRKPDLPLHFSELDGNCKAYGIACHRHTPEIEQELGRCIGREVSVTFTPHLVGTVRGILATMTATLVTSKDADQLRALYRDWYRNEPFVRILPEGRLPETKQVRGSNFCDIGLAVDGRTRRVIVVTAIDNLVKGASGQAIQAMNVMMGFDERTGLQLAPLYP